MYNTHQPNNNSEGWVVWLKNISWLQSVNFTLQPNLVAESFESKQASIQTLSHRGENEHFFNLET